MSENNENACIPGTQGYTPLFMCWHLHTMIWNPHNSISREFKSGKETEGTYARCQSVDFNSNDDDFIGTSCVKKKTHRVIKKKKRRRGKFWRVDPSTIRFDERFTDKKKGLDVFADASEYISATACMYRRYIWVCEVVSTGYSLDTTLFIVWFHLNTRHNR